MRMFVIFILFKSKFSYMLVNVYCRQYRQHEGREEWRKEGREGEKEGRVGKREGRKKAVGMDMERNIALLVLFPKS